MANIILQFGAYVSLHVCLLWLRFRSSSRL
ncbi:hypothetical protein [Achromobacter phage SE2]|nr:hypothetical protein [Achromobacter phage SE2]